MEDADIQAKLKAQGNLPRHIAIIMDGNGRWAQQRDLRRTDGHRSARETVRDAADLRRLRERRRELWTTGRHLTARHLTPHPR